MPEDPGTHLRLWRISNHVDLLGEGGVVFSSRWHTVGRRIVFLAESPAAAILEILVHVELDNEDIPDFTLLEVFVPENTVVESLEIPDGCSWKDAIELTRKLGDAWLSATETALARVPSAIAPQTWNYLLNLEHPDARQVQIASVIHDRFDNRLFRFGAR